MSMRRLAARAIVAGATVAGVAGLGVPAMASAAAGLITVQSVRSTASDRGDLSVTLESTSPAEQSLTLTVTPSSYALLATGRVAAHRR